MSLKSKKNKKSLAIKLIFKHHTTTIHDATIIMLRITYAI